MKIIHYLGYLSIQKVLPKSNFTISFSFHFYGHLFWGEHIITWKHFKFLVLTTMTKFISNKFVFWQYLPNMWISNLNQNREIASWMPHNILIALSILSFLQNVWLKHDSLGRMWQPKERWRKMISDKL